MSGLALGRSLTQFLLNVLVAALSSPAEFGLLVFTTPFVIFMALLSDLGLTSAIVRMQSISERQIACAFRLALFSGVALATLLALSAHSIESLAAMPGLAPVMAGMAVSLALMVGAAVPRALLERDLRYGEIARVEAGVVLAAAACAAALSSVGAGIWALVAYNIIANALRLALLWYLSQAPLRRAVRLREIVPLLSFGIWVFGTNLLGFIARNADNLLIGAFLGSAALGLYGLAYQFMTLPLLAISWPASGVLMATMSRLGPGSDAAKRAICGVTGLTAAVSLPVMGFLSFGSGYPIARFFSDEWAGLPALLAVLAPVGALQSIAAYNGAILLAHGRARLHFWLSILNAAALLAAFLVSLPFGLKIFVTTYAAVAVSLSAIFLIVIQRYGDLECRRLYGAMKPALLATIAGRAAALAASAFPLSPGAGWAVESAAYLFAVATTYSLLRARLLFLIEALRG